MLRRPPRQWMAIDRSGPSKPAALDLVSVRLTFKDRPWSKVLPLSGGKEHRFRLLTCQSRADSSHIGLVLNNESADFKSSILSPERGHIIPSFSPVLAGTYSYETSPPANSFSSDSFPVGPNV
ncbi:hypothetical protein ACHAQJ_006288 [Trichoderma viride]